MFRQCILAVVLSLMATTLSGCDIFKKQGNTPQIACSRAVSAYTVEVCGKKIKKSAQEIQKQMEAADTTPETAEENKITSDMAYSIADDICSPALLNKYNSLCVADCGALMEEEEFLGDASKTCFQGVVDKVVGAELAEVEANAKVKLYKMKLKAKSERDESDTEEDAPTEENSETLPKKKSEPLLKKPSGTAKIDSLVQREEKVEDLQEVKELDGSYIFTPTGDRFSSAADAAAMAAAFTATGAAVLEPHGMNLLASHEDLFQDWDPEKASYASYEGTSERVLRRHPRLIEDASPTETTKTTKMSWKQIIEKQTALNNERFARQKAADRKNQLRLFRLFGMKGLTTPTSVISKLARSARPRGGGATRRQDQDVWIQENQRQDTMETTETTETTKMSRKQILLDKQAPRRTMRDMRNMKGLSTASNLRADAPAFIPGA